MVKFGIYSKWLKIWGCSALSMLLLLGSCTKEEVEISDSTENAMLFGIEEIAQTKVAYDSITPGDGTIAAAFEEGDQIGLYAFYNNFYYYYNEYANFAESVIFANQGLTVDASNNATYSPLRSWTFSTLYGTAPHTLDCVAYYPFKEGYNTDYALMVHNDSGAATLEYYYSSDGETANGTIDFMTAYKRYDDSETPENFRSDMLALESIPLSFTRQLASLNLQVTKPDDYPTEIVVTEITAYFDAYQKFEQSVGAKPTIAWSDMTTGYSLTATTTCNSTLAETGWNSVPEEDASNEGVADLLKYKEMLFFPPDSDILKIVFSITDSGVATTYTWHPHIAPIVANTHYTLSLELDPARAN